MRRGLNRHQSGFTLIEMIMVMVITGILAGMVALFLQRPIDLYIDSARRAELTDVADTTARRIARDLQGALPNSVRVDGTGQFVEFIPITTAGRYRAEVGLNPACPAAPSCDDTLDFNLAADNSFDVLGPAINVNANEGLVVYNLGIPGANAYENAPLTNRRVATTGAGLSNILFTATGSPLPFSSPSSRFQIVATPVTYACDHATGTLWRYSGYGFQPDQPDSLATLDGFAGVTRAALATHLGALCSFAYGAVLQHNGLVSISLSFSMSGESVQLQHQVNVDNVP